MDKKTFCSRHNFAQQTNNKDKPGCVGRGKLIYVYVYYARFWSWLTYFEVYVGPDSLFKMGNEFNKKLRNEQYSR